MDVDDHALHGQCPGCVLQAGLCPLSTVQDIPVEPEILQVVHCSGCLQRWTGNAGHSNSKPDDDIVCVKYGDWFMLRQLSKNVDQETFRDFLKQLSKNIEPGQTEQNRKRYNLEIEDLISK